MKLLNYNEFVAESITKKELVIEHRNLYRNIFSQINEVKPVLNEAMNLVDNGVFDDLLIETLLNTTEEELLENLFQKAKEKFNKAVEIAKEKGKQALTKTQETIIKIGGDIGKVIKMIIEALKNALKEAWDKMSSLGQSAASKFSGQIESKIEGMDKNKLVKEIKDAKTVLGAMKSYVLGGFVKQASGAMEKGAAVEEMQFNPWAFELAIYKSINESIENGLLDINALVMEGGEGPKIPFVSAIAAKVNKIPPFSLLYKVKNLAKDAVGGLLGTISKYATELAGAPGPYEFVALATLIGVAAEVYVKHKASHGLIHAVPGLGTIVGIAGNVAYCLALVAVIETLIQKAPAK